MIINDKTKSFGDVFNGERNLPPLITHKMHDNRRNDIVQKQCNKPAEQGGHVCWKCRKPLMKKLCENEIGGNYEYETFEYKTLGGNIKTVYCCLICQMEMTVGHNRRI